LGINKKNAEKLHLREALYIIGIEEIFVTCNLHTEENRIFFFEISAQMYKFLENFTNILGLSWIMAKLYANCM
jgi:hypothetical protein